MISGDSAIIQYGIWLSQLVTFVAYGVVTIGVGLLQARTDDLPLWKGLSADALAATQTVYNDAFQTVNIIPYPEDSKYQFQYQWFVIQFELLAFLMTAYCALFPCHLERVRPAALTFVASALVLVMNNIDSVIYLKRSELAKTVFEEHRINWTLAGLILVAVGNFLTIISYGLFKYPAVVELHEVRMHMNELNGKATNDNKNVAL